MLYIACYLQEVTMPPKVKITKDEIVAATLELLRREGEDATMYKS